MPPSHSQNLLAWALRYVKRGWPVLPLKGKIPLTAHGLKEASLNETQIRQWWEQWPEANIGLATGHWWFAVDIDLKSGGQETWEMLKYQHGQLPDTLEQITGSGGKHILYQMPDFPVQNSAGKIGPGIDVRGRGGYIVASPSLHPETKRAYLWDGADRIEEQTIAPAPSWLLTLLRAEDRKPGTSQNVPQKISEGGRNVTLFKYASRLRRQGFSAEEIRESLRVLNQSRCHPPLPNSELKTIAESAGRYQPDTRAGLFSGASQHDTSPAPSEELPLSVTDVESAVDAAIAANALLDAVELHREIGKLNQASQVLLTTKLRLHFKESFPLSDFKKLLKQAGQKGPAEPPAPSELADAVGGASGPDLLHFPLTDSGNGERIVLLFGEEIRYCVEMQKWLVWDGRRWAIDDFQVITQKAKQMARLLYAQAATLVDTQRQKAIEKHARQSESAAGIAAGLKRAATEKTIPISALELDQHPYLLNCLNGVIDLRSGKPLPHDRGYLITKLCHVNYNPSEAAPKRFLKFLYWAMGDNPENDVTEKTVRLVAFLQRAFGYSLTSDVSEKAAFVFWGERGNNGKTTLLTTFKDLLSEYSCQISIDTLMSTKQQDAAVRADLADLRGARLVTTSEVEKEHKLSEGKLKYITAGMGKIKSCRKYENPIEFDATHKLFMDANHRPLVRGTDDAIWSRLKCVPFTIRIEKDDPEFDAKLLEKLKAEHPAILAWAVRGCQAWVQEGLGEPPEVAQSNLEWREHDDPLKDFLEDCCETNKETMGQPDGIWVKSSELSACYEFWCRQNRERFPIGRENFNERLQAKGFRQSRSRRPEGKQARTWEGIQIKADVLTAMRGDNKFKMTLLED